MDNLVFFEKPKENESVGPGNLLHMRGWWYRKRRGKCHTRLSVFYWEVKVLGSRCYITLPSLIVNIIQPSLNFISVLLPSRDDMQHGFYLQSLETNMYKLNLRILTFTMFLTIVSLPPS
jgi:hypothetical protein